MFLEWDRVEVHYASIKLIANRWAWRWYLLKWAVIPGQATNLEPQALSRARRHPRQLCKRQPPTRHHHTDQVSGDTYQPNTYQVHQWGREGREKKQNNWTICCLKQNCTSHGRNAQHMQFEKPCMSTHGTWFPDHRWPAFAWFLLSLNYI